MSWFARQAQTSTPEKVTRDQGRYLRAAGVDRALDQWAGPYGVRRFVVRFADGGPVPATHQRDPHASIQEPLREPRDQRCLARSAHRKIADADDRHGDSPNERFS